MTSFEIEGLFKIKTVQTLIYNFLSSRGIKNNLSKNDCQNYIYNINKMYIIALIATICDIIVVILQY